VPEPLAVDLSLLTSDDARRRALDRSRLQTAQHHDAQTRSLFHTVPGMGTLLRLVLHYDIHQIERFPSGQAFAS
jgi:hypothetical protein